MRGDVPNIELAQRKEAEFRRKVMALMGTDEKPSKEAAKIDFLEDDVRDMTLERRLALALLRKPWYNPMCAEEEDEGDEKNSRESGEENKKRSSPKEDAPIEDVPSISDDFEKDIFLEKPSLEKAWAFYEHQVLARYIVPEEGDEKEYDMAVPGEDDHATRLYPWFSTPIRQLGDFGIGIGLYFTTLRYFIVMTFICGLINIPNIVYFSSDEYGGLLLQPSFAFDGIFGGVKGFLQLGSAVCTTVLVVPCPNCRCQSEEEFNTNPLIPPSDALPYFLCPTGSNAAGEEIQFAIKNDCDGTRWGLAAINFATMFFIIICLAMLRRHLKAEERKFDEDEQTASDYSIQIKNPPGDAKDPEEWRRYFHDKFDGAEARVVTCAVANDQLLRALSERRDLLRQIYVIQPGKSLDREDLAQAVDAIEQAGEKSPLPKLFSRLVDLEARVNDLAHLEYPVKQVFVTFESEEDQQNILKILTRSFTKMKKKGLGFSERDYKFRGEVVLNVREPEEPDTIRWLHFGASMFKKRMQRVATLTFSLACCALVWYLLVRTRYGQFTLPPSWLTFGFMLVMNFVAPIIGNFESHRSETTKELATYNRRVLFYFFNFAIAPFLTTSFTQTIDDNHGDSQGLIRHVCGIFILGQVLLPTLLWLDPIGRFLRHVVAPRMKTQDKMNVKFRGGPWNLADQYAQSISILLTFMFYSAIIPMGFFYCSIYLTIQYIIGKLNLLRRSTKRTGPAIATINREFFFPLMVAMMAYGSSLFWTGFPYDRLCAIDEIDEAYSEIQNIIFDYRASGVREDVIAATEELGWPTSSEFRNVTWDLSGYLNRNELAYWVKLGFPENVPIDLLNLPINLDVHYRVCDQNFLYNAPNITFPYVPSMAKGDLVPEDYMTDEQLVTTTYFGWTAFAIIVLCILAVLWRLFKYFRYNLHGRQHKAVSRDQGIPYSTVKSIRAYIPEVNCGSFAYPLIACNIDDLDDDLIHFKDLDRSYKYYDLSVDLKRIVAAAAARKGEPNETDATTVAASCLSNVKSWEPNGKGE